MANFLKKTIFNLNDAEHVAKIQRYFGLVWKEEAPTPNDKTDPAKTRKVI